MHGREDAERRDLAGDDLGHHTLRFDEWMVIAERLAANSDQVAAARALGWRGCARIVLLSPLMFPAIRANINEETSMLGAQERPTQCLPEWGAGSCGSGCPRGAELTELFEVLVDHEAWEELDKKGGVNDIGQHC